jgi:hypothetical protein
MPRTARFIVFVLAISSADLKNVYAQSVEELRAEFESKLSSLRAEFEEKLRQAVERNAAGSTEEKILEKDKAATSEALGAQPYATQLTPAAMPPAASKPPLGLFINFELAGNNFWGVETDYAARNAPDNVFPQIGQVGRFRSVDVNRAFTVMPTLGYYLADGSGIVSASFHHTSTAGDGSFRAPGGIIPSLLPPSILGELGFFPDSATAKNRVEINQLDAHYQYPIQLTKKFGLAPELSIRSLWFKNNVKSTYLFDQPNSGFNFIVDQRNNSWATGPAVGIAGAFELFNDVVFNARGKAGYLLGRSKAEQVFCRGAAFSSPGCGGAFNFRQTEWRGFPFTEGEFSLNYAFPARTPLAGLSASLGYRIGTVFDLVNRIRDVGDEETSAHIIFDRLNLTYDSIFFKLQYLW